jgi:hypothetical protein
MMTEIIANSRALPYIHHWQPESEVADCRHTYTLTGPIPLQTRKYFSARTISLLRHGDATP